jgi:hypothetical protein
MDDEEARTGYPQRRHQRLAVKATRFAVLSIAMTVAIAVGSASVGGTATAGRPSRSVAAAEARSELRPTSRTFVLAAGSAARRFTMREPAGVLLLTRITAPHGVRVSVEARIPNVGGSGFQTAGSRPDPALSCRPNSASAICTQSQEWCPMPAALWQMHLVKTSGPAGAIRIDFVVGPPPASN